MQIETLSLWDDRDDVTLTTFVSKTPEIMPMPLVRPAVIVCPRRRLQYLPAPRR